MGRTGEMGRPQDITDAGHSKAGEGNKFDLACSRPGWQKNNEGMEEPCSPGREAAGNIQ